MRVRMVHSVQGFCARSDGTTFEWPPRGQEIDLPDDVARDMIGQGAVVPVVSPVFETTRQPDTDEEQRGMATAAKLFTRPQSPATVLDEVRSAPVKAVEPKMPEQDDETQEVLGSATVVPAPPPAKRGPGRPRKYPRPGE